jgi:hypothetical protein
LSTPKQPAVLRRPGIIATNVFSALVLLAVLAVMLAMLLTRLAQPQGPGGEIRSPAATIQTPY